MIERSHWVIRIGTAISVTQETGLIAVDAKKAAILAGVALVLFYVIAEPQGAAGLVGSIVGFLRSAAESVITFVSSVFSSV